MLVVLVGSGDTPEGAAGVTKACRGKNIAAAMTNKQAVMDKIPTLMKRLFEFTSKQPPVSTDRIRINIGKMGLIDLLGN